MRLPVLAFSGHTRVVQLDANSWLPRWASIINALHRGESHAKA